MKPSYQSLGTLPLVLAVSVWWYCRVPEPTVLSFRIGQTFEEVAQNSTYPVLERSNFPAASDTKFGTTWVTKAAVIIHFNDANHGFSLPPTKFAALTYSSNKAAALATSPMLEKLPFDKATAVLADLQDQFKAGGWKPYEGDGSQWFDLTPEGKKRLYAQMLEPGNMQQTISLHVPKKYGMTFRLWCAKGCGTGKPPYLFMIDIGVSSDTYSWEPGAPTEPEE